MAELPIPVQNQNSSSSMTQVAIDDTSSSYYLHHSDSPGLNLVSQQLTGNNYTAWSRAMTIALSVKNKLGFIDGSISRPEGNSDLLNSWIRNNNIVISWILNSVSKEISASIIYVESAYEIWLDLKDRFQQRNGPRIFQLRRELMNHTQGQLTVSAYFTKLKTVWEELSNYRPSCSCGKCDCEGNKKLAEHYHMEYVMSFLMGLNDSYAQVRGQLLLMDPIPPINKVFSLITQEEHQRVVNVAAGTTDSLAFYTRNDVKRTNTWQPHNKFQKKERPVCTYCGDVGHVVGRCYKLHGFPPGYRARQSPNSANQTRQSSNLANQAKSSFNNQTGYNVQSNNVVTNQISDSISDKAVGNVDNFIQKLNSDQYQQLMSLLNTHLADVKVDDGNAESSHTSGNMQLEEDWQG